MAPRAFTVPIPDGFDDAHAAPLLCAGIVGYRALWLSGVRPQESLGLYGFGASAHIAIQIARHWGCQAYVSSLKAEHQNLARQLGAVWVGGATDSPPDTLHGSIIFAPAGELVPPMKKDGDTLLSDFAFSRTPYLAGFRAGWFKFTICTQHLYYGDAKPDDPQRQKEAEEEAKRKKKVKKQPKKGK